MLEKLKSFGVDGKRTSDCIEYTRRKILSDKNDRRETHIKLGEPFYLERREDLNLVFSDRAQSDLELERLESFAGSWDYKKHDWGGGEYRLSMDNNRWTGFGRVLLNHFIQCPIKDSQFLSYIQESAKELAQNDSLSSEVYSLLGGPSNSHVSLEGGMEIFLMEKDYGGMIRIDDIFQTLLGMEKQRRKLTQLSQRIGTPKSLCLRDIVTCFDDVLDIKAFRKVKTLFGVNPQKFQVTVDASEKLDRTNIVLKCERLQVEYPCHYGRGIVDSLYGPFFVNVCKSLTKSDLKKCEDAAFALSFLGYINGLAGMTQLYSSLKVPSSFPTIKENGENRIYFKNAYHPLLLGARQRPVPNDVEINDTHSVNVIAGANNGGKTTYLKMIGALDILSRTGAPVPAKESEIHPGGKIYTHFPKTEEVGSGNGRFMDELKRLEEILRAANKEDLVILDEPCSGTSLEDSLYVSLDTIKGLQSIGCSTLYSTHIHEIQKNLQNSEYYKCRNLRVKTQNLPEGPRFTFEIEEGIAEKSYGKEIAEQRLPVRKILAERGIS